jgi:Ni2+-binding GTPase involved in maturation of urease and hydrogenase
MSEAENPTTSIRDSSKGEAKEYDTTNNTTKLSSSFFATPSQEGSNLFSPKLMTEYIPTQSSPLIFEDIGLDVAAFESFSQLPPSAALRLATKAEESTTRSINVLVLGKKGTGKTTLINYLLGQQLGHTDAFQIGTTSVQQVFDKLKATDTSICFIDTPGVDDDSSLENVMEFIRNRPIHAVLFVERLGDSRVSPFSIKLIETVTRKLGPKIWRKVIIVFTCGYVFPPVEYTYEEFIRMRATSIRRMIRSVLDDHELHLPVAVSETSKLCPTNDQGLKILPDGTAWFPALVDMICRRILYGVPYSYPATEQVSWNQTLTKERWLIIGAAILGGFVSRTLFATHDNSQPRQGDKALPNRRKQSNHRSKTSGNATEQKSPFWWPFKF